MAALDKKPHVRALSSSDTVSPFAGCIDSGKVTLDVSGRKFTTLTTTLFASSFLRALVSDRWKHNRQADGSYFVDANPDTFVDILDFLRRNWMPLYWDRELGHDWDRYKKLQQEAEYLGIDELAEWLRNQKYLEAVTVNQRITNKVVTDTQQVNLRIDYATHRRFLQTSWTDKALYRCVDDRATYHTRFERCDSKPVACATFRASKRGVVDVCNEIVVQATLVEDIVHINAEVCRPMQTGKGKNRQTF